MTVRHGMVCAICGEPVTRLNPRRVVHTIPGQNHTATPTPSPNDRSITTMETEHPLLAVGATIAVLPDVYGCDVLGTIAGHVTYSHPETGAPQPGYAIHLARGAFLAYDHVAPGARPWVGTIVAHVDSVSPVTQEYYAEVTA